MTELASSETSELSKTQGKECKVGRLITEAEGWKIVKAAEGWEGTPYSMVGANSVKGVGGDCSGSTNKIFVEAGFPCKYQTSRSITDYILATHRFRQVAGTEQDPLQAGDMIVWPGGHIAVHVPFAAGDPHEKNKYGQKNDMWSAYYPGGPTYGAARTQGFRKNEKYYFYRYFILPGEPGCP
jgi:cell wall-associated NlpC family hydrolase